MELNLHDVTTKDGVLTIVQQKGLDEIAPVNLKLSGVIGCVHEFIRQRTKEFDHKQAHVIVNRENMTLTFLCNETDVREWAEVNGKIELSDEFTRWKINTGESWTPFELADFIRMNRSCFESKEVAANLVKQLRDFKAKVERDIEMAKDDRANYTAKRIQAVNSNLPESFTLNVKLLKGMDRKAVNVEITIHPETLNCILISPDASEDMEKISDGIISEAVNKIKADFPEIVIIEQ